MVDYFKISGIIYNLNLSNFCVVNKPLDGNRFLYKIFNDDYSEHLNLITNENSKVIYIEGNLRKWMYGTRLLKDLDYNDYIRCIKLLALKIGVTENEIWSFKIKRVEFGANLNVGLKYKNLLSSLISYGKLTRVAWGSNSLYFVGSKYKIKFYSKIEDIYSRAKSNKKNGKILRNKAMVLRVEICIKSKSAMPFKKKIDTLEDIKDNFNYILENVWLKIFDKVVFANIFSVTRNLEFGNMTLTDFKEYGFHRFVKQIGYLETIELHKKCTKYNKPNEKTEIKRVFEKYLTEDFDNYFEELKKLATAKALKLKKQL